jgi:hypothetical protein
MSKMKIESGEKMTGYTSEERSREDAILNRKKIYAKGYSREFKLRVSRKRQTSGRILVAEFLFNQFVSNFLSHVKRNLLNIGVLKTTNRLHFTALQCRIRFNH